MRLRCTDSALYGGFHGSDSSGSALVQDGAGDGSAMDVRRTQRSVQAGEAGGEGDDDAEQHGRARCGVACGKVSASSGAKRPRGTNGGKLVRDAESGVRRAVL